MLSAPVRLAIVVMMLMFSTHACKFNSSGDNDKGLAYTIGGEITGLQGFVELQNNDRDTLGVDTSGAFVITNNAASGETYNITILSQPEGQTCVATNASGTVTNANITSVIIECSDDQIAHYNLSGSISGLNGTLVLQNNGADDLSISDDGDFLFAGKLVNGDEYKVLISKQPENQSCAISNNSGSINEADVSNISISCEDIKYSIGGSVDNLRGTLTLSLNATESLSLSGVTDFSFAGGVTKGAEYVVTVSSQHAAQSCVVVNGNGTATADVSQIQIHCRDHFFFAGNAGTTGYELWKTDGTDAGTVLVKDIATGSSSGYGETTNVVWLGDYAYFAATHVDYGKELWRTDGSEVGTTLVKDIYPGSSFGGNPYNLFVAGNKIYFSATGNASSGSELWVSDGSEGGTVQVKELNASGSSNPYSFTLYNGEVYFSSFETTRLWKTNGTSAGTTEVLTNVQIGSIAVLNDGLFLAARDLSNDLGYELYRLDGNSLQLVKDIQTGATSSGVSNLVPLGDRMVFSAIDAGTGNELWVTDGTETGTGLLKDISSSGSSFPLGSSTFAMLNGELFFSAQSGSGNYVLMKTDGTDAGTTTIGSLGGYSYRFFSDGQRIYFISSGTTYGFEPWSSDGTAAGTDIIKDIAPGGGDGAMGS